MFRLNWNKLDVAAVIIGILTIWLLFVSESTAWNDGLVAVYSVAFGMFVLFLGLHGLFVFWSVKRQGRVKLRRLIQWLLMISLVTALGTIGVFFIIPGSLVIEVGLNLGTLIGGLAAVITLWILFFLLSLLLIAAACSAIWFLCRGLKHLLPRYLSDIRAVNYDGHDSWFKRIEIWIVGFPRVLEPSSLRLDLGPMDDAAAKRRFGQALQWQLALGLLLAVYISLNPFLLQSMSFAQTFTLVSFVSILAPLMVLPWFTLEVLGVKAKGIREDFTVYSGAKTRMIQTLVALGTLLIIVRLAVEEVGIGELIGRFVGYSITLFLLSSLVSFVYFNFFEAPFIEDLRERLEKRRF